MFPGGEGGIRTPGPNEPVNRFRVCRIRPLCHLSVFTFVAPITAPFSVRVPRRVSLKENLILFISKIPVVNRKLVQR